MPVELDTERTERELARGLPDYLPRGDGSNNRKLLRPISNSVDDITENIIHAEMAVQVQRAETIDQLAEIGKELELPPNEGETLEHYRARLLAESQLVTSKGTIEDVINGSAAVLGISGEDVVYESPALGSTENGTASVRMPSDALEAAELDDQEIASYLDDLASAGARIEAVVSGTFTYISVSDYDSANHDATRGYDGLDTNGDPKDNGGTYAGLIR